MAGWSSEWVNTDGTTAVANGASLTFTHGLNSTDLVFNVYAARDSNGTGAVDVSNHEMSQTDTPRSDYGSIVSLTNSNQINILLASQGLLLPDPGATYNVTNSVYGGTDYTHIKVVAVAAVSGPAPAPEAAGTEVVFIAPYSIPVTVNSWTKVQAQPDWANSGATTLVVEATTFDVDNGGNTSQTVAARASSDSQFSVNIISHGGTSAGRSVMNEQALIPCSSDGSFEYIYTRNSSNGTLRSFQVVGYIHKSPFIAGSGDLCKFFPDDSGYQMFRNGLTMQWMSSPAFTTESSQVINFPTPFAAKPFKVTASTRYPTNDGSSQQWIQVVAWDSASVTIRAQSQNVGSWTQPVYADIIAIGITEAIGCIDSSAAASGTKISELKNVKDLKEDDLFVLSRDKESDGSFDTSNNITLSSLSKGIEARMPPSSNIAFIDPVLIYYHSDRVTLPWTTKDLSAHIPKGATGCIINITYGIKVPDDGVPAQTLLRAKSGGFVYTAVFAGAWGDGDYVGGNSQGFYPINVETRSIDISIPRSPQYQNVYLIGYF